jgi:hypothetical protein
MRILKFIFAAVISVFVTSCQKKKSEMNENNRETEDSLQVYNNNSDTLQPIVFSTEIPAHIEKQYAGRIDSLLSKHPNLVEKFSVEGKSFIDLVEKYTFYSYVKFYFIQESKDSKMNLGVTFSKNNDYKDISSDEKYILENNKFTNEPDLQSKIAIYKSSLATQATFNGKPATECVIYRYGDVAEYINKRKKYGKGIAKIDFSSVYFFKVKDLDGSDYNVDSKNYDRISFAVHAVYNDGSVDLGYDAGDLKP